MVVTEAYASITEAYVSITEAEVPFWARPTDLGLFDQVHDFAG